MEIVLELDKNIDEAKKLGYKFFERKYNKSMNDRDIKILGYRIDSDIGIKEINSVSTKIMKICHDINMNIRRNQYVYIVTQCNSCVNIPMTKDIIDYQTEVENNLRLQISWLDDYITSNYKCIRLLLENSGKYFENSGVLPVLSSTKDFHLLRGNSVGAYFNVNNYLKLKTVYYNADNDVLDIIAKNKNIKVIQLPNIDLDPSGNYTLSILNQCYLSRWKGRFVFGSNKSIQTANNIKKLSICDNVCDYLDMIVDYNYKYIK